MTTWALVPVRSFARGKSRLGHLGAARALVARALCEHVIDTLLATPGIDGVLVATDGDDVATAACARGAHLVFDPPDTAFARILDHGLDQLARHGADAGLIAMADLPRLSTDDIAAMLAALEGADVVLAPDRDQLGTNALALRLSVRAAGFASCFGHVDSYRRHLAACAARGLDVHACVRDGLAFDLDHPADVDALIGADRVAAALSGALAGPRGALEAEARIGGEGAVRPERGGGVGHTVERIAAIVAGITTVVGGVEPAQHAVQRRPLGGDAPRAARGPS